MQKGEVANRPLSPAEQQLYALVPHDGSTVGNVATSNYLGWSQDTYWMVRDSLEEKGLVARGRGRGGSIRRTQPIDAPVSVEAAPCDIPAGPNRVAESDLYEPLLLVLADDWAKDQRADLVAVEDTSQQGRRATGGRWSRPDLVTVEVKTFEYVPGKFLEVTTFEVKPCDQIEITAVYEALAHRRSATHSYVLLHVPTDDQALLDAVADVRSVARSHGIGVVVVGDPGDYSTWDILESAERVQPDPSQLDQFIGQQLPSKTKKRIARALR